MESKHIDKEDYISKYMIVGINNMFNALMEEAAGAMVQLLLFSAIPILWWICKERKQNHFFAWIGLKKMDSAGKVKVTLAITITITILYGAAMAWIIHFMPSGVTQAGSHFSGMGVKAVPAVLIYGYIRTGLSEEIFFRGFLLKSIGNRFGFVAGNTVQALVFGLLHGIPFALATRSVPIFLLCTLLPGAFGWFEGWMNEKRFHGSIIPSWILHGMINSYAAFSVL